VHKVSVHKIIKVKKIIFLKQDRHNLFSLLSCLFAFTLLDIIHSW